MKKILIILTVGLIGCIEEISSNSEPVEGYIPVYGPLTSSEIKFSSVRSIKSPGKIYSYGNLLFVNEKNLGIHIINNEIPSQPIVVGFMEILGNNDIAIRDDIMYADHMGNLVAIKLNDFNSMEKIGELPLSNWLLGVPPPRNSHFQCINSDRGIVVGWKKETAINWECYAF